MTRHIAASWLLHSAIESADEVILYSLDPKRADLIDHSSEHLAKLFNGYLTLGQALIDDASERRALVDSLYRGLADSPRIVELCFDPHHGLRIRKGSQNLDVVIAFSAIKFNSMVTAPSSRSVAHRKASLPVSK